MNKISAYCAAYLLNKNNFLFEKNLQNLSQNFDEVVVCVNIFPDEEDDKTFDSISHFINDYDLKNIKLVESMIARSDIGFDGKTKQVANQECSNNIRVLFDLDEYIHPKNLAMWRKYASLLADSDYECLMIPVIDLWGNKYMVRKDKPFGFKFRMHKSGVRRGILKSAILENGKINIDISDTTEPIDQDGNLVKCIKICSDNTPVEKLQEGPYVIHEGYLNFDSKSKLNESFWKKSWADRCGFDAKVMSVEEMKKIETISHKLPI